MINSNELRKTNYVNYLGEYIQVSKLVFTNENAFAHDEIRADPVPLTLEILEKCGFEWYEPLQHYRLVKDENWFSVSQKQFDIPKEKLYCFSWCNLAEDETMFMPTKIIYYVHQLQNLIFALCSEELNIEF